MHFPLKKIHVHFFINQILRISVKFLQFLSRKHINRLQCNAIVFFSIKNEGHRFPLYVFTSFRKKNTQFSISEFQSIFLQIFFILLPSNILCFYDRHFYFICFFDIFFSHFLFRRQHRGRNKCIFTGLNIKIHRKAKENKAEKIP